ncbi:MAG: O-antigen ligase family protein [Cyanobacteria bacterium P01_F01_bin.4]
MKFKLKLKAPASFWDTLEEWGFFVYLLFAQPNLVIPPIIRKFMNLLGYIIMLLVLIRHWKRIMYISSKDILLIVMLTLSALSIFWAAVPDATAESVRALMRTTIIGMYFAVCYSPLKMRKLLTKLLAIWGITSLMAAAVPGYGIVASGNHAGNLVGIFSFKNTLGQSMGLAAIMASIAWISGQGNRLVPKISLVIALGMVFLSGSKTSLVSLVFAFSITPLYFFSRQRFKVRALLYTVAVLFGIGSVLFVSTNLELVVVDWLGKDLTFTGRFDLWAAVVRQGMERPWLGYGHGGFWNTAYAINAAVEKGWPPLPQTGVYLDSLHSHNGFVEIFVQLGVVGLVLAIAHFAILFSRYVVVALTQKDLESLWMLQYLIMIAVVNLTEAGTMLAPASFEWILYVAIALSLVRQNPTNLASEFG